MHTNTQSLDIVRRLVLVSVVLFGASIALAEQPCSPGLQRYDGGCLSDKMVSFVICMKNTTGGRITSVSSDAKNEKKGVFVDVKGGGSGIIANGQGRVRIDTPNETASMKQIAEHFDPQVSKQCWNLATAETSRAARRSTPRDQAKPSPTPPPPSTDSNRRELPSEAADRMERILKPVKSCTVEIGARWEEPTRYANQIAKPFRQAGWNTMAVVPDFASDDMIGVAVYVKGSPPGRCATAAVDALKAAGIAATVKSEAGRGDGDNAEIFIGTRD